MVLLESEEQYAQIKNSLQAKTLQNHFKQMSIVFLCQRIMGLFRYSCIIMDFDSYKHAAFHKTLINWWIEVVWIIAMFHCIKSTGGQVM